MLIGKLSKKYSVDKRNIDYWTNCDLLHPSINKSGYRDYNEDEFKLLNIVNCMGITSVKEKKIAMELLRHLPKRDWEDIVINKLITNLSRFMDQMRYAEEYTRELYSKAPESIEED